MLVGTTVWSIYFGEPGIWSLIRIWQWEFLLIPAPNCSFFLGLRVKPNGFILALVRKLPPENEQVDTGGREKRYLHNDFCDGAGEWTPLIAASHCTTFFSFNVIIISNYCPVFLNLYSFFFQSRFFKLSLMNCLIYHTVISRHSLFWVSGSWPFAWAYEASKYDDLVVTTWVNRSPPI